MLLADNCKVYFCGKCAVRGKTLPGQIHCHGCNLLKISNMAARLVLIN